MAPSDPESTDAQLVRRTLAGERAAFGFLAERRELLRRVREAVSALPPQRRG